MSIERKNAPDYQDMRSTDARLFVAPHIARDATGPSALVLPASMMQLGKTRVGDDCETWHPTITVYSLNSAAALCFLPNADELEATADAMRKLAAGMREAADAQLAAALKRGKPE